MHLRSAIVHLNYVVTAWLRHAGISETQILKRKKAQVALAPPVFEGPWTGWQLLAGRPLESKRPPIEHDGDAAEVAFLNRYLDLADTLLASDEEEGGEITPRAA